MITNKSIIRLISIVLCINALLMFCPFLMDSDPTIYFIIAKHMALHGHWQALSTNYGPWLDKPHFPFWITALSFKLFGCHAWSYVLPGFLFYLLGGVYTYKLARLLYQNQTIALLSFLIYVTILRLMLSSLDVRAEAYLLGEIMPACYYWLKYYQKTTVRYAVLAALFTGFAIMTKGIFVLVTVGSGVFILGLYEKQWRSFISVKWMSAVLLICLFSTPEIIALYSQFGIAGPKWFLVGSQFGRFFETGRIIKHHGNALFFAQTFLWGFFPWCIVFMAAIIATIKNKRAWIYCMSSFLVTFLMFSFTPFKMDYYTNIIFPFAAILSAQYLHDTMRANQQSVIFTLQIALSFLLILFVMWLVSMAALKEMPYFMLMNVLPMAFLIVMCINKPHLEKATRAISYSVMSITISFFVLILLQTIVVAPFSADYVIANDINARHTNWPVYEYQQMTNLSVYLNGDTAIAITDIKQLPLDGSYYLVMDTRGPVADIMKKWPHARILMTRESLKLSSFDRRVFLSGPQKAVQYQVLIQISSN